MFAVKASKAKVSKRKVSSKAPDPMSDDVLGLMIKERPVCRNCVKDEEVSCPYAGLYHHGHATCSRCRKMI